MLVLCFMNCTENKCFGQLACPDGSCVDILKPCPGKLIYVFSVKYEERFLPRRTLSLNPVGDVVYFNTLLTLACLIVFIGEPCDTSTILKECDDGSCIYTYERCRKYASAFLKYIS